ncbi:hypothetical protein C8Q77DRAFT_598740 [Trametes polyzona]|nr:hypothetical protein C8Q77DRAFT_598740 [Trametes polyzona]
MFRAGSASTREAHQGRQNPRFSQPGKPAPWPIHQQSCRTYERGTGLTHRSPNALGYIDPAVAIARARECTTRTRPSKWTATVARRFWNLTVFDETSESSWTSNRRQYAATCAVHAVHLGSSRHRCMWIRRLLLPALAGACSARALIPLGSKRPLGRGSPERGQPGLCGFYWAGHVQAAHDAWFAFAASDILPGAAGAAKPYCLYTCTKHIPLRSGRH